MTGLTHSQREGIVRRQKPLQVILGFYLPQLANTGTALIFSSHCLSSSEQGRGLLSNLLPLSVFFLLLIILFYFYANESPNWVGQCPVHRKYLIGLHKYHLCHSWIPKYHQHNLLIRQSWVHCSWLWEEHHLDRALTVSQRRRTRSEFIENWKFGLRQIFPLCMSVEECG